ncbi:MAG: HD domain-containing protein [Lachnospiraceae bacterium]|nr:HD domain-containing protein [Lachnospiraceae bacterium]
MRFIKELREGDMISSIYLCKDKKTLQTKAGKNYYSMQLHDKTGSVDGKVWDLSNGIGHFESMDYIQVDAQVVSFQGALQLNIRRVRKAEEGEYDPVDYMPCSKRNLDEMYNELLEMIATVRDEHLHKLLEMVFTEDADFIKAFKIHSAAKTMHHNFAGGLLEHSLSVARLCEFYVKRYPVLNHDLLITAALCHDIGKMSEISSFPENDYTDEGQLIGHIVTGTIMLDEKIRQIDGFPVKLANELKHCILSHHGELEYGSPKKPALIEAVALAFADNTDAKLEGFIELLDSGNNNGNSEWLGFSRMFETNVRPTSR